MLVITGVMGDCVGCTIVWLGFMCVLCLGGGMLGVCRREEAGETKDRTRELERVDLERLCKGLWGNVCVSRLWICRELVVGCVSLCM